MKYFKNKKLYTLVLLIAIGGLLLSGCQKKDSENKNEENMGVNASQNKNNDNQKETETSQNKNDVSKDKTNATQNENDASSKENEEVVTEESEGEIKTLEGTVKEGMMQTIIILGEDNNVYQFEKNDEKIETGETGILIGNPITVKYKGELDPNTYAQNVEVVSMIVEDAK